MELTGQIDTPWPLWKKLSFRVFCAFAILYIFPFPIGFIPGINIVGQWYTAMWDALVPWTGEQILNISYPITVKPNGSGDTTYNYVQIFLLGAFTVIITLIWSAIDFRRPHYNKLLEWLSVLVRFYLAFQMINYGLYKVIKTQFPQPTLEQIVLPFGHSSPMGLAWKFMGYSNAYNIFTGLGEFIGGLLLINRRTSSLGAIVLAGVMSNVVMINYSYDVPVKIFSSMLLFFVMYLLVLDAPRIINLFILNRPTQARKFWPHFKNSKVELGTQIAKYLLVLIAIGSTVNTILPYYNDYGDKRIKPPLYGVYDVLTFVKNGEKIPANLDDKVRWKRIIIDYPGIASIHKMRDQRQSFVFKPDTAKQVIENYLRQDTARKGSLHYTWTSDSTLTLEGTARGDSLKMDLLKVNLEKKYNLLGRGFNWINEYPYNR